MGDDTPLPLEVLGRPGGLGFLGVWGFGFRVQGCGVQGFRASGSGRIGFRVEGSAFRLQGSGFSVVFKS